MGSATKTPRSMTGSLARMPNCLQADTATINQLVHIWKFEDDADRREFWARLFADKDFMEGFMPHLRPLSISMEVKLLMPAPWGHHP